MTWVKGASGSYDGSSASVIGAQIEALVTDVLNVADTNFSNFDWWKLDLSTTTTLYVMWNMQSTRNGTTYNHSYVQRYSGYSTTSTDTYLYHATDANIAAGATASTFTSSIFSDTAAAWTGHIFNYEVWYSNEHRSLAVFRKTGSDVTLLGLMMDPDHLTQAGPFPGGHFFDHKFLADYPGPLTPASSLTAWDVMFPSNPHSVRGRNVVFKNFYALNGVDYAPSYSGVWPNESSEHAYGVTHMAEVNDMACTYASLYENATVGVVQIPNDSNYYLNIGPGGGGLFLNVGASAPSFFS